MTEELVNKINDKIDIQHLDEKEEAVLIGGIFACIITFIYWLLNKFTKS